MRTPSSSLYTASWPLQEPAVSPTTSACNHPNLNFSLHSLIPPQKKLIFFMSYPFIQNNRKQTYTNNMYIHIFSSKSQFKEVSGGLKFLQELGRIVEGRRQWLEKYTKQLMYMLNPALSRADQPEPTHLPLDPRHHREALGKEQILRQGGRAHENFLLPSFLSLMVIQNNRQLSTSSLFYICIYMYVYMYMYVYIPYYIEKLQIHMYICTPFL